MFKELLSVFKSDSLMEKAYERSFKMLDITEEMFHKAKEVLRESEHTNLDYNIDDQDIEVNKFQREVRKYVFNHLVMAGTDELASGLVLVSIVIDIERIGDYTKNIIDIAQNHAPKLDGGEFEEEVCALEEAVGDVFKKTIACFKSGDEEQGLNLLNNYKWVSKQSDKLIRKILKGHEGFKDVPNAVALTLYVRSLKRIYSHLRNVVTSVVNPFHRIGYKPKK